MRNLVRILGQIPARGGSKRLPAKNLRYLYGKPLIAYAIECAQNSSVIDEIYVNTDSEAIAALAGAYGVKTYRRSADFGLDGPLALSQKNPVLQILNWAVII